MLTMVNNAVTELISIGNEGPETNQTTISHLPTVMQFPWHTDALSKDWKMIISALEPSYAHLQVVLMRSDTLFDG
jgi:hypothetical protein